MVGVVANTDNILSAEAQKAAHFVNLCNRRGIPILFLQNSLPNLVEIDSNQESVVLKDRGKLCAAIAAITVPKISLTLSACYQDDYLLMCGPSFSPNFHFMWPSSKMSPLSMEGFSEENDNGNISAFYAASYVLTDSIILPQSTRETLAGALRITKQQVVNPPPCNGIMGPVFRM
jgi:3-methylcrotonyl-CoA carboxylase beta subunit